ncbi:hypothetical protein DIPPA_33142 [Diplonema papillatum]|nr:hypothetical protein DIPPA_33142 [Diplonema papillatum]
MAGIEREDIPENPLWNAAAEEMIKEEEKRVDLTVALARNHERNYLRCKTEYERVRTQEKLEECAAHLNAYSSELGKAFCPLEYRALVKCAEGQNPNCSQEQTGFSRCMEAYAAIGGLTQLRAVFDLDPFNLRQA